MAGEIASLHQLSVETRAKLRSTQILTSLPQIISELMQNSLDAGASQVDIGVDCEEWTCWVRDDGAGISKDGLALIGRGSEEGRYGSSKAYNPGSLESVSTFGFRGEAISSAADLCCLEISSRTSKSRESWSVILKGGKSLYIGPSIRWRRESAGTVVCVRDAFFSLPIRRLSHPPPSKTLELIKQEIETYALAFPHVSFSLENTNKSRESSSGKVHVLRIPKTRSSATAFRHLFGRALTEHVEEIDDTSGELRIEGFISLVGAHSKSYQYLYINRHPISYCDLHRIIDNRFSSSSFMKHAYDEGGETSLRPSVRRSPRKGERRPIYVLNLTIPPRHIDNCLEPAKATVQLDNKNVVSSFLSSVIQGFLVRHSFSSEKRAASVDSPSPRKRRKVMSVSPVKGDMIRTASLPTSSNKTLPTSSLYIRPGEGFEDDAQKTVWRDPVTGEAFIVDPRTGNSYPQTRSTPANRDFNASGGSMRRTLGGPLWSKKDKDLGHSVDSATGQENMPTWLQDALGANKAYAATEPRIPSLPQSIAPGHEESERLSSQPHHHACHGHAPEQTSFSRYLQPGSSSLKRFRKEDLANAQVVNQVDRKFIACLVDDDLQSGESDSGGSGGDEPAPSTGKALILIDQHAADERVRVERFLKDICIGFLRHAEGHGGVKVAQLSPPVPVLLTHHEASRLGTVQAFREAFDRWGIRFEDLGRPSSNAADGAQGELGNAYAQVFVSTVPKVVHEKLLLGNELQELIKGFLAKLESDQSSPPESSVPLTSEEEVDELLWVKALRWCPRELLDLVNSKACRGAIMFNDPLTLDQCKRLVKHLSDTAFPFQCAHGRPSLVPLTHVSSSGSTRTAPQIEWDKLASMGRT
ncbi:hypothetical protein BV22DRAFT_1124687 [Leucogyrophana mollusca]|uniref:Uncharacterized protein n=1 Tax=Leucogyrophana mollusca TaxID=85980 RepID=A0ACB8BZD4_9AGAM|nr:hypothetical protein BV22DRAFT_1124687 [Leucogyrophana mollusca]